VAPIDPHPAVRDEDMARVLRAVYDVSNPCRTGAVLCDLPRGWRRAIWLVSRSGAGTVAELGAIAGLRSWCPARSDRPGPVRHAGVLAQRRMARFGLRKRMSRPPLAAEISALAAAPERLTAHRRGGAQHRKAGRRERLADLVAKVAGIRRSRTKLPYVMPRESGASSIPPPADVNLGFANTGRPPSRAMTPMIRQGIKYENCRARSDPFTSSYRRIDSGLRGAVQISATPCRARMRPKAQCQSPARQGVTINVGHKAENVAGADVVVCRPRSKRNNPELMRRGRSASRCGAACQMLAN